MWNRDCEDIDARPVRRAHVSKRGLVRTCVAILLIGVSAGPVQAQGASSVTSRGLYASRDSLVLQAESAQRQAKDASKSAAEREYHRAEEWTLRHRLEAGDFSVGDRIVLTVAGEAALADTFTVRTGPSLDLPGLPPITLMGVLRSELEDHLRTELSRYFRQPSVRAVPLLRVAVMGQIGRPGYYDVPADMRLSDVLMAAGGPSGNADLNRSELRRADDELYSAKHVRTALSEGMSLDLLNLRSGDEFFVGERRQMKWGSLLQVASILTGIIALIGQLGS